MEIKKSLLAFKEDYYQKKSILETLSNAPLKLGVLDPAYVNKFIQDYQKFLAPPFFPVNEELQTGSFFQLLSELYSSLNSTILQRDELEDAISDTSKRVFLAIIATMIGIRNLKNQAEILNNTSKPLNTSGVHYYSIGMWNAVESYIDTEVERCSTSFNGLLTLPVESKKYHDIKEAIIQCEKNSQTDYQIGSLLFRNRTKPERDSLVFSFVLEAESLINNVLFPCMLPTFDLVDYIEFLDSSGRSKQTFYHMDVVKFCNGIYSSLELFFPSIPVKTIRIHYKRNISLVNLGLEAKIDCAYSSQSISQFVNEASEMEMTASVPKLYEPSKTPEYTYHSVIGGFAIPAMNRYKRMGNWNTNIYDGKAMRASFAFLNASYMSYKKWWKSGIDLPSTFVDVSLIKKNFDTNKILMSVNYVPHPMARPFNKSVYELLNGKREEETSAEVYGRQKYTTRFFSSGDVTCYVPVIEEWDTMNSQTTRDTNEHRTTVEVNNHGSNDVIASYEISSHKTPMSSYRNEQFPWSISFDGTVFHDKVGEFNSVNLLLELYRIENADDITPVVFSSKVGIYE